MSRIPDTARLKQLIDDMAATDSLDWPQRWAHLPDAGEIAFHRETDQFDGTTVTAFLLAAAAPGEADGIRMTGRAAYYVNGDPRNPELIEYMDVMDKEAKKVAGVKMRWPGGQPATIETVDEAYRLFDEYCQSEHSGQRLTQERFAHYLQMTSNGVYKGLKRLGISWAVLKRTK